MGGDPGAIDRLRAIFDRPNREQQYEPIEEDNSDGDEYVQRRPILDAPDDDGEAEGFSWFEYSIFLLLGVAMLWAWNMFLAAAPYFQTRFADNQNILDHFQPAITSVACVTNLSSMFVLGQLQAKASYQKRILCALVLNLVVFALLTISVNYFRGISATAYFVFTLIMVFSTSVATGLCQNGAFAFASSFGRPEYIQAIMTGQAVAGVLPSVAQILAVLSVPVPDHWADAEEEQRVADTENLTSATVYFLTATGISMLTLIAVVPLIRKQNRILESNTLMPATSVQGAEQAKRKVVGMWTLYKKLHWLAASVFLCFLITMFMPVFTQKVLSNIPEDEAPRLFRPSAFIPLGFLIWNLGDLGGRLMTLGPLHARNRPVLLFIISILRGGFLPLYLLCNIMGKGAVIQSDAFYLIFVQFLFGLSNGWLGSCCMMAAGDYVLDSEREASGGFMAINLVAGLTAGSLLSFTAAGVS
ncbi:nucleoside transporter [Drepanopeziza brunnea f. sp. 'multigermtubi' MB_m1]|uniref:Nucleoside transporter n=1 Tax=Marssonina brunnea f. sp. multigermtubi (strain MB_m1) TaxID=1072389 RepID=K1X837_MARBU|nr:nucleoside transporter [Drepanopeziza brunnea f. sp. 'multigermtubi' MB_m1]EKD21186.1 nucleoside transporter [Drepanopeziza brunnea f. sp. 'multigermtubi' MB_m1]